ncbi:MAG: amylo-alpha-1,6-glucosidase, partial [Stellaceae bacterium]
MAPAHAQRRTRAPEIEEEALGLYYTPTTAASRIGTRSLKQGDSFAVLDGWGDAQALGPAAEGFFHEDMRHLSSLVLLIDGERPLLLSSRVTRDNTMLAIDLANPDLSEDSKVVLARDQVHLLRSKVLDEGACFERIEIRNFAEHTVAFTLQFGFAADFADMFEVRGQRRQARGEPLEPKIGKAETVLAYRGRDGVERRTHLQFDPPPATLTAREARYLVRLAPHAGTEINLTLRCARAGKMPSKSRDFAECCAAAGERVARLAAASASVSSSNDAFNAWIERSEADLDMLVTEKATGPYPYAGIPWFNTAFGRDGLIAAIETVWAMPHLARGVLGLLAATQAKTLDPAHDAEPGKILHEMRKCEMAATGEVPFARYYGTVDATPLFVVLAGCYLERTGDREFAGELWPHVEAALQWMHVHGDADKDGFLEYDRRSDKGLANQGWKDSGDSIFHADGRLAEPPIALVEVQAYFYAALQAAAQLARALDKTEAARPLEAEARDLRRRFDAAFWCDEIGSYALALDGAKRPLA